MNSYVDQKTCSKCHLCVTVCPSSILENGSPEGVRFNPDKVHICVKCGHCMAVCETKSIFVEGLSYEKDFADLPKHTPDYAQFMDLLKGRRSIRLFKDMPVPEELLRKVVDAVTLAPFGVDKDHVHITIIKDRKTIEAVLPDISRFYRMAAKMFGNPFTRQLFRWVMPKQAFNTVLNFIVPHMKAGLYDYSPGKDDISRGAPAMILFHAPKEAEEHTVDCHIAITYASLAGHSLGLGATMIGLIGPAINQNKKLRQYFSIPEGHEVVETLILGYPRIHFKRAIIRPRKNVRYI